MDMKKESEDSRKASVTAGSWSGPGQSTENKDTVFAVINKDKSTNSYKLDKVNCNTLGEPMAMELSLNTLIAGLPNTTELRSRRRDPRGRYFLTKKDLDWISEEVMSLTKSVDIGLNNIQERVNTIEAVPDSASRNALKQTVGQLKQNCTVLSKLFLAYNKNYTYDGSTEAKPEELVKIQKPDIRFDKFVDYVQLLLNIEDLVQDNKFKISRPILQMLQFRLQRIAKLALLKDLQKPLGAPGNYNGKLLAGSYTFFVVKAKNDVKCNYSVDRFFSACDKIKTLDEYFDCKAVIDDHNNFGLDGFGKFIDLCIALSQMFDPSDFDRTGLAVSTSTPPFG